VACFQLPLSHILSSSLSKSADFRHLFTAKHSTRPGRLLADGITKAASLATTAKSCFPERLICSHLGDVYLEVWQSGILCVRPASAV
jgi:hypothetical protein